MRALMLGRLEIPMPISAIAAKLDLSEKRLRSLCRRVLRRTPSDHDLALCLQHVRALLTTTRLPIKEIAIATGFASHAGFSRTYRKSLGQRPKDARQGSA
jgi:AraC family carnitine catabolism transcriptional activator